jgi:hypothetical protein
MPIRINLLAETQAAENLRRRDPVKRFAYVGALVVALALAASSWLQLKVMLANRDFAQVQAQISDRSNGSQRVQSEQKKINAAKTKLAALLNLSTNRFLQGNLLNALQQSTVEGVALTRLRVQQSYQFTKETTASADDSVAKPKKPATVTENIVIALDAQDSSANPGDQVNKFKDAIANQSYFNMMLDPTNGVLLTSLSAPQSGPDGKPFVSFTVECHYPEYTHR